MPTITTTQPNTVAKRYTRLDNPPNIEITKRFLEVNATICRHSMITFEQLQELHPDISQHALYPITRLSFHHGFSNRPYQQETAHRRVPGRLSTYITPDKRGAQLHAAFFADPVTTPKYTYQPPPPAWLEALPAADEDANNFNWEAWVHEQDRKQMTWGYMRHQHSTTSTLLNYQRGATADPDVSFSTEADLWCRYAPEAKLNTPIYENDDYPKLMARDFIANPPAGINTPQAKTPLQLKTTIDWLVKLPGNSELTEHTIPITTQPDAYFNHQLRTNKPKFFFLESDEDTETIRPHAALRRSIQLFTQTSLLQKYLTYIAAFKRRAHCKQFGIPSFNVITVLPTPHRTDETIKKMMLELHGFITHSNFLLFIDRQTLARYHNNPYHPDCYHLNLNGDQVHIKNI